MFEPGRVIEKYVVEALLGQGGMAAVYCVRHRTLGTRHALKLLTVGTTDLQNRLVEEGRVQASLQHPNIVGVTDVITHNGMPGLVMEYVEGPALDAWLMHHRPDLDEALAVFRGIVMGVGAAHAAGVVHRDLKPANILLDLTEDGAVPRVMDFGLVKVDTDRKRTQAGSTMGTPAYMAPEQIRDAASVDRRADLYSLGVLLYELTTGRVPYPQHDLIDLFQAVVQADRPEPRSLVPDLPFAVDDTIDALMELDPKDRIPDCASVLTALDGPKAEASTVITERGRRGLGAPKPMPQHLDGAVLATASHGYRIAASMVRHIAPATTIGPTPTPPEPRQPRPSRLPWLLVGLLSLLLLGVIGASTTGLVVATFWEPAAPPRPVAVLPAPAAATGAGAIARPDPVAIAAAPDPSEADPLVAENAPPPATPPAEPVAARPVAPAPAPVAPPPPPSGTPEPAPVEPARAPPEAAAPEALPGYFTATFHGGDGQVVLVDGAARYGPAEPVPPGAYTVRVSFAGEPQPLTMPARITIASGETARIRCSWSNLRCNY